MAINHATLAGDLGKLFGGIKELNTWRGTTLTTREATLRTQYGTDALHLLDDLQDVVLSTQTNLDVWANGLSDIVANTIVGLVNADRITPYATATDAFVEWVRQLRNDAQTFNDCLTTLTFGTAVGAGAPTADYKFHYSDIDTDGKRSDLLIPDRYLITVQADADSGGTRWAETLHVISKTTPRNALDAAYPNGTGTDGTLVVIDPATDGGFVSDPGFSSYVGGAFTAWTRFALLTAADVFQTADDARTGATGFCMTLKSDGTDLTGVKQTVQPTAGRVHSLIFKVKGVNAAEATARVWVSLRNAATNAVINDDQGNALRTTSDQLTTLVGTGVWTSYAVTWAMPARLPEAGVYLDIRLSKNAADTTAATANTEARVDHTGLRDFPAMYDRGVRLLAYSGAIEPLRTDQWELTAALATGTISDYFIRWLDRTIGLAVLSVKLPTVAGGGETISDAVIA